MSKDSQDQGNIPDVIAELAKKYPFATVIVVMGCTHWVIGYAEEYLIVSRLDPTVYPWESNSEGNIYLVPIDKLRSSEQICLN